MIKCHIALGNLTAASRALQDLKSRDSDNSSSYASETTNINRLKDLEASADKDMNKSDFRRASLFEFEENTFCFISILIILNSSQTMRP